MVPLPGAFDFQIFVRAFGGGTPRGECRLTADPRLTIVPKVFPMETPSMATARFLMKRMDCNRHYVSRSANALYGGHHEDPKVRAMSRRSCRFVSGFRSHRFCCENVGGGSRRHRPMLGA